MTDGSELATNRLLEPGEEPRSSIKVILRALDSICLELNLQPNIVKIDVEGHELAVLKGFLKGLASTDILIIEKGKRSEIIDLMLNMNFIGPSFFHFAMGAFLSYPQRRAEDPVFIRPEFSDRLTQFDIKD